MKYALYTFYLLFWISSVQGQSTYLVKANRIMIIAIVNSDTVMIGNAQNIVRLNGDLGLFEITYDPNQSEYIYPDKGEIIKKLGHPQENSHKDSVILDEFKDLNIKFYNQYAWLADRIYTTETSQHFVDQINVRIDDTYTQTVPVDFTLTKLPGTYGFTLIFQIRGKFNSRELGSRLPELNFAPDLLFSINLTVQVLSD